MDIYPEDEQKQLLSILKMFGISELQLRDLDADPWSVIIDLFSKLTEDERVSYAANLLKYLDPSMQQTQVIMMYIVFGFFEQTASLEFRIIHNYLNRFPLTIIEILVHYIEEGTTAYDLDIPGTQTDEESRVHMAMLLAACKEILK